MSPEGPSVKRDLRQEVTDALIEALEKGCAPWQRPWQSGALEMPLNPTSGKSYRGANAIHLMLEGMRRGFEDPRWLTYRQAWENGWQVGRGEKGTQIEFWRFPRGRVHPCEDSRNLTSDDRRDRPVYRVYTVFNAAQVQGVPAHAPRVRQEWEVVQSAEAVLLNSGARITHDQADRAFYDRASDRIHLPPRSAFPTPGDYYGTALHELAHNAGTAIMPRRKRIALMSAPFPARLVGIIIETRERPAEHRPAGIGQDWRVEP